MVIKQIRVTQQIIEMSSYDVIMKVTYRDCNFSKDVLRNGQALLNHLLVELVQGSVHQLHADPDVTLATDGGRIWKEIKTQSSQADFHQTGSLKIHPQEEIMIIHSLMEEILCFRKILRRGFSHQNVSQE